MIFKVPCNWSHFVILWTLTQNSIPKVNLLALSPLRVTDFPGDIAYINMPEIQIVFCVSGIGKEATSWMSSPSGLSVKVGCIVLYEFKFPFLWLTWTNPLRLLNYLKNKMKKKRKTKNLQTTLSPPIIKKKKSNIERSSIQWLAFYASKVNSLACFLKFS